MIDVPVEVKDALRDGRLKKNYRIVVLGDDGTEDFTIDNENLVSESVSIDERMNSGDKIKFGLCEGSSLEFQYFGLPNITGKRLQVLIDVDFGASEPYTITMGYFNVKKCSRQASTGIIRVTAYNKLMSEYLDVNANKILFENISNPNLEINMYDIENILLEDYQIDRKKGVVVPGSHAIYWSSEVDGGSKQTKITAQTKKTPLNSYASRSPSSNYNLSQESGGVAYGLDPNKYYLLESNTDFSQWEENLYNYIKTLIDDSDLTVTGDQYIDWSYAKNNGARTLFCIELRRNNNVVAQYSDMGYLKAPNVVTGKFNDIFKHTITGCDMLLVFMAYRINIPRSDGVNFFMDITGNGWGYEDVHGEHAIYRSFRYLNDEIIPTDEVQALDNRTSCYNIDISPAEMVSIPAKNLPDFTLREIQTATFETVCQFGQLDRVTDLFSGVELNHSRLYPQETLYPDNALYPDGAQNSANKSMYSKLWADEGNVHKWRNLIITYKGLDENQQEQDFVYETEINADGTDDYDCSDNWLFKNLVWTAEQIEDYAETMAAKMQDVTWFPFEMWCAGLPYLETGDEIEIPLGENSYTSYILQRQLKGIQNLQDTYINGNLDIF